MLNLKLQKWECKKPSCTPIKGTKSEIGVDKMGVTNMLLSLFN